MAQIRDFVLGLDIGGTKIAAALVDRTGRLSHRLETLTPAHDGREAILERVQTLGRQVMEMEPRHIIRAVGAASAGQIDPQFGRVNYSTDNLSGWTHLDLTGRLEAMFDLPATVENDVNAMAVAEMKLGAGRGLLNVFCVMVGTGIGGAVIVNGELYTGVLGGAGEVGHAPIQMSGGRLCNCGRTGCLEAYSSSRVLLADFTTNAGAQEILHRLGLTTESLSIQVLAAAFNDPKYQNWELLQQSVTSAAEALGAGLAFVINLLSPELIIIAGSVQLFGERY